MLQSLLFPLLALVLFPLHDEIDESSSASRYFSTIYAAENLLMDGEHEEALKLYSKAFHQDSEERILFIKDLHNALMLAYQSGSTRYFERFLYHLKDFDVDKSFFRTVGYEEIGDSEFSPLVKTFFENKPERDPNSQVCSVFERLVVLDKSIRSACREKYGGGLYTHCGEEIALLDSLILDQLTAYFKAYGIPRESEFCNINKAFSPPYKLIIRHNLQWCRLEIVDYLKPQIGTIHPQVLASILNSSHNDRCVGAESKDPWGFGYQLRLGNHLYVGEIPEEYIQEVNQNRKALHLDKVQDFHRKIIFQDFNPEYHFVHSRFTPLIDADPGKINSLREKFADWKVTQERLR